MSWRDAPEDNTPVTETDRVVVRAGSAVTVPVLDNDFSPAGDELDLVADTPDADAGVLAVRPPGDDDQVPTGQAFVSDRFVRYVAPPALDDAETFTIRYLATNAAGQRAPGMLEVQVVPAARRNEPPEPPLLETRAVAGDTVKLRLPGVGVDPDGDPVTLTGIGSAPDAGAHPPLRRDLPALPGLPGQRRHRRVHLHGHRRPRGAGDRHRPGRGHRRRHAPAAAGRARHDDHRARPRRARRRAGQRLRRRRRPGHRRAGRRDRGRQPRVAPGPGAHRGARRRRRPQRRGRLPRDQRHRHLPVDGDAARRRALQQPAGRLRRLRHPRRRRRRSTPTPSRAARSTARATPPASPSTSSRPRSTPTARTPSCASPRCSPRPA